jgi:hypothetical protein
MELLKQKITIDKLTIEITVHDLLYRLSAQEIDVPKNHLYATITARDQLGLRIWTTPMLSEDGKIKAYNSVGEALSDAKRRLSISIARVDLSG